MNQPQFPSIETIDLTKTTLAFAANAGSKTNFHLHIAMQEHLHNMKKPQQPLRLKKTAEPIGSAFREMLEKELAKRGVRR